MRTWEIVRVALEGIRRTPLRIALTAAGVAIATGALLSMIAFAEGVRSQAERPLRRARPLQSDRRVGRRRGGGGVTVTGARPRRRRSAAATADAAPKTLDDAVLEPLAAIPGSRSRTPR